MLQIKRSFTYNYLKEKHKISSFHYTQKHICVNLQKKSLQPNLQYKYQKYELTPLSLKQLTGKKYFTAHKQNGSLCI